MYARVVAAPLPRPSDLVAAYQRERTDWASKPIAPGVLKLLGVGLVIGIVGASSGRGSVATNMLMGMSIALGVVVLALGPSIAVSAFIRSRLRTLLLHGELRSGTVVTTRTWSPFAGSLTTVTYVDESGHQRHAGVHAPLPVGSTVMVIADRSSTAAVLWPPQGIELARRK